MKEWTALLDERDVRLLDADEAMILGLILSSPDAVSEMMKEFPCQVMKKRLDAAKAMVDDHLWVFVSMICNSPGKVVMWAYTLTLMYVRKESKLLFKDYLDQFGKGIPTDEALRRCWDTQKDADCPLGNWLDDMDNWPKLAPADALHGIWADLPDDAINEVMKRPEP